MTAYDDRQEGDHRALTAAEDAETEQPAISKEKEEEYKIYIGRVPTKFNEETVKRILLEKLSGGGKADTSEDASTDGIVEKVELIYPHDTEDGEDDGKGKAIDEYRSQRTKELTGKDATDEADESELSAEHRGFGFVTFTTEKYRDAALNLGTIKGGRKKTSKRLHTMHLRPYIAMQYDDGNGEGDDGDDGEGNGVGGHGDKGGGGSRDVCYLWNLFRCPYGDACKFRHSGEGVCTVKAQSTEKALTLEEREQLKRKRKGKCFVFKKKGRCPKGDRCPFWHDDVSMPDDADETDTTVCKIIAKEDNKRKKKPNSEKDCINWKTKGKCRKGDKCEYKHDPELRRKALEKKAKKKRQREDGKDDDDNEAATGSNKRSRKQKQPLSVRVFGLNYDTTEEDVIEFFETTNVGHPVKSVVFPKFDDSGRSKGYCGVYFASPKAAQDAVKTCDNAELHGRWLRVQTGKSMTVEEWDGLHKKF